MINIDKELQDISFISDRFLCFDKNMFFYSNHSNNNNFDWSIVLSDNWELIDRNVLKEDDTHELSKGMNQLAYFKRDKSAISISAIKINREIDKDHWLIIKVLISNQDEIKKTLFKREKYLIGGEEEREQSGIITLSPNKKCISWISSYKDGDYIYTVHASSDIDSFRNLKYEFLVALLTFKLLNSTNKKFAEDDKYFEIKSPFLFSFSYMDSWDMKFGGDKLENEQSIYLYNYNQGERKGLIFINTVLLGEISFHDCIRKTCLNVADKEKLHLSGFQILSDHNDSHEKFFCRSRAISIDGKFFDVFLRIFKLNQKVVVIGLLNVEFEKSKLWWWAVNNRAFQIICDSLYIEHG